MKIVILALCLNHAVDTATHNLHTDFKFHDDTQKMTSAPQNEKFAR